jgi:hypothetical protein
MKHKRKILRPLAIATLALVLAMALTLAAFCYGYYREGYQSVTPAERQAVEATAKRAALTGAGDQEVRKASNAYLSVPEWFIVYISDDYAFAIAQTAPSAFAYGAYLADYWRLYGRLAALIENAYPPDSEYHTMVRVIGVSTTVEFGLKAVYEDTVGHLFERISGYATPEDAYAARVARDYVTFIRLRPWYEFEFRKALVDIWTTLPNGGESLMRKYERRAILSAEYTVKWGYAALIEWATHEAFGVADIDTYVRLSGDPDKIAKADERIRILAAGASANAETTAIIPRYQPFTDIAPKVALNGGVFRSIAGQAFVTVGVLAPDGFRVTSGATVLASTPVHIDPPTSPRRHRLLYWVAAEKLGNFLSETAKAGGMLEHIYDF